VHEKVRIRKEQRGEIIPRCSDGTQIERIETIKYLGIIIDDSDLRITCAMTLCLRK